MKKRVTIDIIVSTIVLFSTLAFCAGIFVLSNEANTVEYIYSANDLEKIRKNLDGHFVIGSSSTINISDDWVPIGDESRPFTGYLEGNYRSVYFLGGFDSSKDNQFCNLGLFGVNKGTIKHLSVVYSNVSNGLEAKKDNQIFSFGGICCTNNGYITGCNSSLPEFSISDTFSQCYIGGVVCFNYGQIQGCSYNSHFSVKAKNHIVAGCIAAVMYPNSIVKYCYRSGHAFLTFGGDDSVFGYCVGVCKGGTIQDIGFSSPNQTTHSPLKIRLYDGNVGPSLTNCGTLVGSINLASNMRIQNIVIDCNSDFYIDNLFFGFVCGSFAPNGWTLELKNCCCSGEVSNLRTDSHNSIGIFSNNYDASFLRAENNYFIPLSEGSIPTDCFGFSLSNYQDLSLGTVGLDDAVWIKGEYNFYLNYEKNN